MREQQRMNPPVQQLQREVNQRHLYSESYNSGRPSFDNTYCQPTSCFPNVCQTLSRPDNRGYPDQSIRNLHSSFMPARFTYPPAESNEAETNQLRDKKFRGFDDQRLNDSLSCHPARHHYEETHSVPQDNTKRMKTEYGYFPASQQFPPPLPPPQYPNIESPVDNFAMSSSIRTVKSHKRAHSDDQGLSAVVSEEKTVDESSVNSSTNDHPHLLALPEDRSHLTALHCFIRSDCVYIFCAEAHEVDVPRKGRKKPLTLGQIGIGCIYCRGSTSKLKGCSYFPSSVSGIYNATMIIQQRHFPVCPSVTKEVYLKYNKLKGLTARSASTKQYWISSAKKLGMVDTPSGVFFKSMIGRGSHMMSVQDASSEYYPSKSVLSNNGSQVKSFDSLVDASDRMFATEYAYFVMAQMTTTTFTEADRLGKRKGHIVGFPGLACKYCYGGNGSGRFFPLTLKTFSDVSKSLHVLRNHLVKCAKAPAGLSAKVNMLYEQHQNDKCTAPFGSQKIFFDHIWRRLHPELNAGSIKASSEPPQQPARKSSCSSSEGIANEHDKSFEIESPDSQHGDVQMQMPPLPPLPGAGSAGSDSNQEVDFHNSESSRSENEAKQRGPVKKRYLNLHYHGNSEPYSDADMSVAMILANGMGRQNEPAEDQL
eukprot:scaffold13658_cov75-Cyclotella_meneghiniana.AAC.3